MGVHLRAIHLSAIKRNVGLATSWAPEPYRRETDPRRRPEQRNRPHRAARSSSVTFSSSTLRPACRAACSVYGAVARFALAMASLMKVQIPSYGVRMHTAEPVPTSQISSPAPPIHQSPNRDSRGREQAPAIADNYEFAQRPGTTPCRAIRRRLEQRNVVGTEDAGGNKFGKMIPNLPQSRKRTVIFTKHGCVAIQSGCAAQMLVFVHKISETAVFLPRTFVATFPKRNSERNVTAMSPKRNAREFKLLHKSCELG